MFTKAARKALRKIRKQAGGSYVEILKEGERAALMGLGPRDNPYQGEDAEIWREGYDDTGTIYDALGYAHTGRKVS